MSEELPEKEKLLLTEEEKRKREIDEINEKVRRQDEAAAEEFAEHERELEESKEPKIPNIVISSVVFEEFEKTKKGLEDAIQMQLDTLDRMDKQYQEKQEELAIIEETKQQALKDSSIQIEISEAKKQLAYVQAMEMLIASPHYFYAITKFFKSKGIPNLFIKYFWIILASYNPAKKEFTTMINANAIGKMRFNKKFFLRMCSVLPDILFSNALVIAVIYKSQFDLLKQGLATILLIEK